RSAVVPAPAAGPMQAQNERQSRRNEQQIVELIVQKARRPERLQQPAVQRIEPDGAQTHRVRDIAKLPHNNAQNKKPVARATLSWANQGAEINRSLFMSEGGKTHADGRALARITTYPRNRSRFNSAAAASAGGHSS